MMYTPIFPRGKLTRKHGNVFLSRLQFDETETPNDGEETEAETVNDLKLIVDLSSESAPRRSSRERKQPVYYGRHLTTETPTVTLQIIAEIRLNGRRRK